MLSVVNFHLRFNEYMTKLCENFRSIALIEVKELDVYGSLALSNLITYILNFTHEKTAS